MSAAIIRALRRAKNAIYPHDRGAYVFATARTNAHNDLTWTIETESAPLARKGRRRPEPICGIAESPAKAADLFIEGLRRVVEQRAGEAARRRT